MENKLVNKQATKYKKVLSAKSVIQTHSKSFGGLLNNTECITLTGISRNTYYKYKREIKEKSLKYKSQVNYILAF